MCQSYFLPLEGLDVMGRGVGAGKGVQGLSMLNTLLGLCCLHCLFPAVRDVSRCCVSTSPHPTVHTSPPASSLLFCGRILDQVLTCSRSLLRALLKSSSAWYKYYLIQEDVYKATAYSTVPYCMS